MQADDEGIWVEYDLHILRLLNVAIGAFDGEGDEMVTKVRLEPWRDFVSYSAIASLIQREA